jgi:hypothetical protein
MASSISPLSYLDTSAYQSLPPLSSSSSTSGAVAGVSTSAQWQAMQQQGDLSQFLNDSMAAALFQPTGDTTTGASANTLVDNMLQQVLGAYQTPSASSTTGATSVSG